MRSAFLAMLALAVVTAQTKAAPPVAIGSQLELFVDNYLIDTLKGARLEMHSPQIADTALTFDSPWEGIYCGYVTVIRDGGICLMYYRGNPGGEKDGNDLETTCLARGSDGIHWTKPDLGLFEVNGSRHNNIVLAHQQPFSHNFAPFLDDRPGTAPDARFKAIAGIATSGLFGFASGDGIHWRKLSNTPVFTEQGWVFDSQNVAFWSESEQKYVLYYRKVVDNVRSIARATSSDFLHWSPGAMMGFHEHPPTAAEQLYTNQTAPYFRAPHIYLSLAARFMARRQVLPAAVAKEVAGGPGEWLMHDCSDTVLMSTRGGNWYDRPFPQALVRPGLDPENWGSRGNYAARGILQTGPAEMSIYVQRHYGMPSQFLQRLTLRLDGLASISAGYVGGEMTTKPITFNGHSLELNYCTSAAGGIRVEIQDAAGKALPGFAAADCDELAGDSIAQTVRWRGGNDLRNIAKTPVRLRFVLREADLYSLRFR